MSDIATPEFLSHLKSLYPAQPGLENPWFFVAAVAFSASNLPEAVPLVFQHALKDISQQSPGADQDSLLLARKMRDAIFKSGILSGYSKAINALSALHDTLPESLRDTKPLRDVSLTTEDWAKAGRELFEGTYGDTADSVQSLLDGIYPDLGYFSTTFAYGYTYSFSGVMSQAETSFAMVAALITVDTPRQITWHLNGAVRNGASVAEVQAVRKISIEAARAAGVKWKNEIPDV
jgi:alkylhydroperoxidase/carboxymuconolactone decarboxylase family protein YurZ